MNDLQIKKSKQTFNYVDITLVWAGINICLPSFMLGGILVPGINPISATIITFMGNLILAIFIYFMALPGLKKCYSSALLSRYIFGYPFGSSFTSILVIISMLGWSAILLELSVQALMEITLYYDFKIAYEIIIIPVGVIIILSTLAGPEKISYLNKYNVPILIVLLIWITYIIFNNYNINELLSFKATGNITYNRALDLIIGGTIAGVFISSDLNRYARDKKSLSLGVIIGTVPITLCLAVIGMLAKLATGYWNPVIIIKTLGLGIPAMLLLVLSVWTTIQASLYSGSLAVINILPKLSRKIATIILGTTVILIGIFRILANYENWLILLNNLFSPIIAISLYKIANAEYNKTNLDWKAVIVIPIVLLLNNIIPTAISSTLLTMLYTFIIYFIIDKITKIHNSL